MIKWRTLAELAEGKSVTPKEILENAIEAGECIYAALPSKVTLQDSQSTITPCISDGIFEITRHSAAMLTKHPSYQLSRVVLELPDIGLRKEFFLSNSIEIVLSDVRLKLPDLALASKRGKSPSSSSPERDHLPTAGPTGPAPPTTLGTYPWIAEARAIAGKILVHEPKYKQRSINELANKVASQMKDLGITGRGGRALTASTIKRHALGGIKK